MCGDREKAAIQINAEIIYGQVVKKQLAQQLMVIAIKAIMGVMLDWDHD